MKQEKETRGKKSDRNIFSLTAMDVALVILILLLTMAFVIRATFRSVGNADARLEAVIYENGRLLKRLDLKIDQELHLLGDKFRVQTRGGKIAVIYSQCPRNVCVHMGWIQHPGETIICVPYKMVIEIVSSDGPGLDAISY